MLVLSFTAFDPDRTQTGLAGCEIASMPPDAASPMRYLTDRVWLAGIDAIRSIEAPRGHHAARWRGGRVAACGAGAAKRDARNWFPRRRVARPICDLCGRIPPRPERGRLYCRPERDDRIPLGRE